MIAEELVVGETYTYHEVKAPDGYKLADDVTFTFDGTKDLSVSMMDLKTETYITKTDITGSNEIEGATLTVAEADNLSTPIDEWVSQKEPHIIKGLLYGKEDKGHSAQARQSFSRAQRDARYGDLCRHF